MNSTNDRKYAKVRELANLHVQLAWLTAELQVRFLETERGQVRAGRVMLTTPPPPMSRVGRMWASRRLGSYVEVFLHTWGSHMMAWTSYHELLEECSSCPSPQISSLMHLISCASCLVTETGRQKLQGGYYTGLERSSASIGKGKRTGCVFDVVPPFPCITTVLLVCMFRFRPDWCSLSVAV